MAEAAPEAAITFSDAGMLVQAAIEGQGIALVRSVLAQEDLAAGRLVMLSGQTLPAAFSYYAVTDQYRDMSENCRIFLDWIKTEAAEAQSIAAPFRSRTKTSH